VPIDKFINERKNVWQRLEELLQLLDRMTLRKLHREEVRELGRIYRRTASDLAIARAESRDPRLINYLNSLVIRAHGRIYRADPQGGQRIRNFFSRDFPQTFRKTWRYTATSFAVFLIFMAIAFFGTRHDPDFSEFAGVPAYAREVVINHRVHWWERLNNENQIGSTQIFTNNIRVTFYAFALGAIFGLGTLYVLAFNGAQFGAITALTYHAGYGNDLLLGFVISHGVIELSCIFIAGGAGLLIGTAILMPGNLSRADAFKSRGLDAVKLIVGCIPVLVVAGIIEGFVSPQPIPPGIKIGIGLITGITLFSYLLLAGRDEEPPKS
jgi:uncharacterized membrane protein SpoIIM required for sporulation